MFPVSGRGVLRRGGYRGVELEGGDGECGGGGQHDLLRWKGLARGASASSCKKGPGRRGARPGPTRGRAENRRSAGWGLKVERQGGDRLQGKRMLGSKFRDRAERAL